ncbi:hypothetical protein FQV26_12560 [Planococcus sp. CPCC 101016]|uniref:hypothetical protein n=1 Tax=Planococcus sp. CPCC 101016 TaxID=2599617 RepID=UPI0011B6DB06|nr:hypothetical protein [Planococcus sp. CPCC 101016]TWT05274.1 hypothetical protein FQV26_12560 [Planococcus sp. CPCC 101016]
MATTMAEMQKRNIRGSGGWLPALMIFLLMVSGWMLKPESQEAKNLKNDLQTVVIAQTGEKSNLNKKRIDDILVSRTFENWDVELVLNADKGFTIMSTKQMMWQQAIAILTPLSDSPQLNNISISWIYPVADGQNSVKDEQVMSFRLDKETRDQLIWANVEPVILPDITLDYKEHPVLNE